MDFANMSGQLESDSVACMLAIVEIKEKYSPVYALCLQHADCFLVVYSITSMESFETAKKICEQIAISKNTYPSMILVANKLDLASQRQVTRTMGQQLADFWCIPFFETSVNTSKNSHLAFFHGYNVYGSTKTKI
eukprot:Phypoly_transcript_24728.p1 GENE.Phypoly_transcript_24728~~Phypoly_transcript_24728.p1  ORF type:complete len:135 (+),score=10.59 Phypoly_transcript_24728:123-527(+)